MENIKKRIPCILKFESHSTDSYDSNTDIRGILVIFHNKAWVVERLLCASIEIQQVTISYLYVISDSRKYPVFEITLYKENFADESRVRIIYLRLVNQLLAATMQVPATQKTNTKVLKVFSRIRRTLDNM